MDDARTKDGIGAEGDDVRHLFSYSLQHLAAISNRIALLAIKPAFGLNVRDWSALALLDYLGEATLQDLSQRAGVQKSQMSRTITALEGRGFIDRTLNPSDRRSTVLRLSPAGSAVVLETLAAARERNRRMLARLSPAERVELMRLIEKTTAGSLEHLAELRHAAGKRRGRRTSPPLARAAL